MHEINPPCVFSVPCTYNTTSTLYQLETIHCYGGTITEPGTASKACDDKEKRKPTNEEKSQANTEEEYEEYERR